MTASEMSRGLGSELRTHNLFDLTVLESENGRIRFCARSFTSMTSQVGRHSLFDLTTNMVSESENGGVRFCARSLTSQVGRFTMTLIALLSVASPWPTIIHLQYLEKLNDKVDDGGFCTQGGCLASGRCKSDS